MKRNWRLAYAWWLIWGFGRWLALATETRWISWRWYWRSGRKTSWYPLRCACGWRGPERWAFFEYDQAGPDDVAPVTLCPKCGEVLA